MHLYTVCDTKAGIFEKPFCERNDETARRAFQMAVEAGDSILSKAPGDFSVYLVGYFDDESGEIAPIAPRVVCRGSDFAIPVIGEAVNG